MTEAQIDDYLMGMLNPQKQEEIETLLSKDSKLAEAVNQRRLLIQVVEGFGDLDMKDQINKIHKKELKRAKNINRRNWFYLAASFLILALAYFFWLNQKPVPPKQVFASYYQAYPLSFTTRDNVKLDPILAEAEANYRAGNYENAQTLFETYFSKDSSDSKIRLAIGICQIETEKYDAALQHFEKLVNTDFDRYKEHAYWYAALIYLKKDNLAKGKTYLELIVQNDRPPFNQKAREILAKHF